MSAAIIIGIIIVCILVGYFILKPGEDKDDNKPKDDDKPSHKDDKDKDATVTVPTYSYDGQNIHNIRSP